MKDLFMKNARSLGIAARLVSAAIIIGFLYYGRVVLVPLALALLIAFALHPVVRKLVMWRVPRGLSVALVVGFLMLTLTGLGWFIGGQVTGFAAELPHYRDNIVTKVRDAKQALSGGIVDRLRNTMDDVSQKAGVSEPTNTAAQPQAPSGGASSPSMTEWLSSIGAVTDPVTTFGLVILLVAMMLMQWSELRGRFLGLVSGNFTHTTNALADASKRVGHFLFLQLVYNTGFGIVVGLSLWGLGVPYAGLWGLCAALFRYIPYAGPLVAMVLPLAVSLVTSSGWGLVASIAILFVVLELISNNFIEPWLYGSKLGVSEIGIIMASVAWTYLWGAPGLLLATPLTVCLVVLGKHVPALGFFATLLGNEDAISGPEHFYQRLLAGDSLEAAERAEKLIKDSGRASFISDTLLPALAHARRDQVAGWLTAENNHVLMEEVKAVAELLNGDDEPTVVVEGHERVVLWSACPLTDAILPVLEHEVGAEAAVRRVKSTELIGGVLKQFQADGQRPMAVSVLHLSEVDTPKASAVLRRIKQALPDVPVQVSRLGESVFTDAERAALSSASCHASSIVEARAWASAYAAVKAV